MGGVALRCPVCGPVVVTVASIEVHANARDGFRLLTAPCPRCGEVITTGAAALLDAAVAAGAPLRELRCPDPPFTTNDLLDLHQLLADDDWCARLAASGDV